MEKQQDKLSHLPIFETFLKRMGFKRIEGSVYGLLVLSEEPLSSEQIETTLGLSQSAVSQALKTLSHFGAIENKDGDTKRLKLHIARENTLSTVATIFRKREGEAISEFKHMIEKIYQNESNLKVKAKLQVIIATCDMAESVMKFVSELAFIGKDNYIAISKKLPLALNVLTQSQKSAQYITGELTTNLKEKFIEGLSKINQMNRSQQ